MSPQAPATAGNTRIVPAAFDKAAALVRRRLAEAGLNVIGQFELPGQPCFRPGLERGSCAVLLVDSPVLLFQAIVLDRAAAAFMPLHVVVYGDGAAAYVYWANPMTSSGLRPPAPAKAPLENLCARVTEALAEFPCASDDAQDLRGR